MAGALPFTKLQVAPAAVVLFGYVVAMLAWRRGFSASAVWTRLQQHRQASFPTVAMLPIFGYTALMLLVTTWTRMGLPHYLILLLGPLNLTGAAVARLGIAGGQARVRAALGVVAITLLIQVAMFASEAVRKPRMLSNWGIAGHAVADEARRLAATGDTLRGQHHSHGRWACGRVVYPPHTGGSRRLEAACDPRRH
jgi:hypothetical protein